MSCIICNVLNEHIKKSTGKTQMSFKHFNILTENFFLQEKKDIEEDLNNLADHILSNPHSPLYKTMKDLNMLEKPETKAQPTICILSLMKRNFHDMRSIQQLCGVGYVRCLFQLRAIHDKFCKPFLTLRFEDLDNEVYKNPFGSLFVGNIPVVNILRGEEYSKPQAQTNPYSGLCWDTHYVKFLRNGTSHVSTPDSEYVATMDNPHDMALVSAAADCLEVFSRTGEREASSSTQSPEISRSENPHKEGSPQTPKDKKENKDVNEFSKLEETKDSTDSQLTSDQSTREKKGNYLARKPYSSLKLNLIFPFQILRLAFKFDEQCDHFYLLIKIHCS